MSNFPKFSFRPTSFQYCLITALTFTGIAWLLLLTGFKEYWGFWQSPDDYSFLKKEYPQWLREYVNSYYDPILGSAFVVYLVWVGITTRELWKTENRRSRQSYLLLLLSMTSFFAFVVGVMCANNLINLIDRGELHGNTHLQLRE
ncbi:MAG: hypothetical protein AAF546_07445 [Verrucomicrobiota bacterium]